MSAVATELLRRNVLVIDFFARSRDELPVVPGDDAVFLDLPGGVRLRIGLRDDEVFLFPRREVERVRLRLGGPFPPSPRFLVLLLELFLFDDLAQLEGGVAGLGDVEVVEYPALLHLLVRRLDEAEVIDARVAGERRDQADVRAFGRLDRAHAPVVRGVDVADLEPGPLARQPSRPESGEAPLVGDLGERVRLVHELGELRGAVELLDRRDDRLRVDEVVRHRRVDVLVDRHLFLDRPFHPDEPDAELVLE